MTCIARSPTPLCVVRGLPASFPFTHANPPAPAGDGSPIDLTGSTVAATLTVGRIVRSLPVTRTNDLAGRFKVPIAAALTADLLPGDGDPRLVLTITDPQGNPAVYVYPLLGTLP